MSERITNLRVYKPDGDWLEFEVGASSTEGKVESIHVLNFADRGDVPVVQYPRGIEARFIGFPYAIRIARKKP